MSFVAVTKIQSSTGSSCSGSVTSVANNALFAGASAYMGISADATALTPSGGGTWTVDQSFADSNDVNNRFKGSLSSCPAATGGTQTITVSNGGSNGVTAPIYEFSDLPTASILDSSVPASAAGTGTTATTNSETNSQEAALFFGVMVDNGGTNPSVVTGTTAGWVYPEGGRETNGATFQVLGSGYKLVSSIGAETSSWTLDNVRWQAMIACYKVNASNLRESYSRFPKRKLRELVARDRFLQSWSG